MAILTSEVQLLETTHAACSPLTPSWQEPPLATKDTGTEARLCPKLHTHEGCTEALTGNMQTYLLGGISLVLLRRTTWLHGLFCRERLLTGTDVRRVLRVHRQPQASPHKLLYPDSTGELRTQDQTTNSASPPEEQGSLTRQPAQPQPLGFCFTPLNAWQDSSLCLNQLHGCDHA